MSHFLPLTSLLSPRGSRLSNSTYRSPSSPIHTPCSNYLPMFFSSLSDHMLSLFHFALIEVHSLISELVYLKQTSKTNNLISPIVGHSTMFCSFHSLSSFYHILPTIQMPYWKIVSNLRSLLFFIGSILQSFYFLQLDALFWLHSLWVCFLEVWSQFHRQIFRLRI